jgi:type I restriction enzyme S subunit
MDSNLFLQQFGHLAQGEGGIKKLRDVILQLAVRGKLVEQNPADEPADVLLKSILKKKEAILGKSKVKSLHRALANETTHELPSSWAHTTLDELGVINPRNDCDANTAAGFVPMTLVSEGYGVFPRYEERNWIEISKGYTHFANDDVGLAKITPCFENSKSCVFRDLPNGIGAGTTELHIFRDVTKTIVPAYVWIWIKSPEFLLEGERRMTGSAGQKRVPKDYFALKPFPLPPLAEQKRIVAKVDELMALCDKLEAEQKNQRTLKTQAVQSTLHHLTNAESPASFGTSLNILERTFGNWFDNLATVKHLRATILQLAVQGKLVPQNPTEEPASNLLKRIEAEKLALKKRTNDARIKIAPDVEQNDVSFVLPNNWKLQSFENLFLFIDYRGNTPPKISSGIPLITAKNIRMGFLSKEPQEFISEDTYIAWMTRGLPKKGDLFFTTEAPLANVCLNEIDGKFALAQRTICLQPYGEINTRYVMFALMSGTMQSIIDKNATGMTAKGIKAAKLKLLPIPIPPFAEQKRIVAKVDELMTLCDQLEAHITHTQTLNTYLMDSLIHRMTEAA